VNSDIPTPPTRKSGPLKPRKRKAAQHAFLEALAECVTIKDACQVAGIHRSTVYEWQEHDQEFSFQYHQARADADDVIRAEMKRRAIDGVDEFVTSMGKIVYHNDEPLTVPKYSDSLLALLAKSRMPEFRDKSATLNVTTTPKEYINTPDDDGIEEEL